METTENIFNLVNGYIKSLDFTKQPVNLYNPVEYVLSMGGKRLRPVLMLTAYNLYKDDLEKILPQAAAIEIYHNYTLLHDDLMDRADMRRGKLTVHKVWSDNTAVLSGDAMLVLACQYMAQNSPEHFQEVMSLFYATALEICEGQQMDMDFETRMDVKEAEYIEMIRLKTSVLLACALKIGAILGGANSKDAATLYAFGTNLGLAFQLQDDLLDVYGDSAVFGKKIGGDILCNKKTFLLIKALEHADDTQRISLNNWLEASKYVPEEKIAAVTRLYDAIGVKKICVDKMHEYFDKALENLVDLNISDDKKKKLSDLSNELVARVK